MRSRNPAGTRQQILDAAERHFALYGFAGTSLRAVIKDAGVNIASIAYHFGNKEDLFNAVVERFATPVVVEQLRELDSVKYRGDLRLILSAFYQPPLRLIKSRSKSGKTLALFLGRMQVEPEPIFSAVDEHFSDCRNKFLDAFRECMPMASETDLQWSFEFMLSLIVSFLTRQEQIRKRFGGPEAWAPEEACGRMVQFCLKGMNAT